MQTHYMKSITALDETVNAAGVEAVMRTHYGTLCHLSRDDFRKEIDQAKAMEKFHPGILKMSANSHGMTTEFDADEQRLANLKNSHAGA